MTVTVFFTIFFLFICFFYFLYKNKKELQQKYDQRVRKIQEEQQLQKIVDKIKQEQKEARQRLNNIENKIEAKRQQYQTKYNIEKEVIFNELEKQLLMYKQAKKQAIQAEVQVYSKNLKSKMAQSQNELIQLQSEIEATAAQLTKLQDTRKAAYNAILKQKEVKKQADNYRLLPSTIELSDIKKLQKVKLELAKPRILSMLIWQTYWQPLAKNKFPIILKDKTKMGVYKITNLKTNECYIGQAVKNRPMKNFSLRPQRVII